MKNSSAKFMKNRTTDEFTDRVGAFNEASLWYITIVKTITLLELVWNPVLDRERERERERCPLWIHQNFPAASTLKSENAKGNANENTSETTNEKASETITGRPSQWDHHSETITVRTSVRSDQETPENPVRGWWHILDATNLSIVRSRWAILLMKIAHFMRRPSLVLTLSWPPSKKSQIKPNRSHESWCHSFASSLIVV